MGAAILAKYEVMVPGGKNMVPIAPVVDLGSVTKKLDFEALEGYELVRKPDTSDPTTSQVIENMLPPPPPHLPPSCEASLQPQMPPLPPEFDSPKRRKHHKKMWKRKPSSSNSPSPQRKR